MAEHRRHSAATTSRKQGKKEKDIEKLDLKDDVLRRANGFYTYFAADIAYHRNKFDVRGFDRVINIWGADHHGHVARLKGALDALGLDGSAPAGHCADAAGEAAAGRRGGAHVQAHRQGHLPPRPAGRGAAWTPPGGSSTPSPTPRWNSTWAWPSGRTARIPVYYVQYAHARICSLLRALADEGVAVPGPGRHGACPARGETEQALIKQLAQFCEEIQLAARDYDPSHINRYLQELAGCFHRFYTACRIKGEAPDVAAARLKLADDTRIVLKNGLELIGVDAPEKM